MREKTNPLEDKIIGLINPKGAEDINLDNHEDAIVSMIQDVFTNNGRLGRDQFQIDNALDTSALARFIPNVITNIVHEAIEPALLITPRLFEEIRVNRGFSINLGAIGAMEAGIVAEGGEGRTQNLTMQGGEEVTIRMRKHGLNVAVTDEVIKENQWDTIGLWTRAAGRAMARHKEKQSIDQLNENGSILYDNASYSSAIYGSTTGRGIAGTFNGSMSLNDLMKMYGHMAMMQFTPDTVLMNPLAWATFATDPEMKEIVLKGSVVASEGRPMGTTAGGFRELFGGRGLSTKAVGRATAGGIYGKIGADPFPSTDYHSNVWNPLGATLHVPPGYLPSPIAVLVSPFVRYNATSGTTENVNYGIPATDVIMADSYNCGLLGTDGNGVTLENFDDPSRDIMMLKVRETYGHAMLYQGRAVGVARNIVITKNYVFQNMNSASLKESGMNSGTYAA